MSTRAGTRLAWSACAFSLVLTALSLLLLGLNLSRSDVYIYDYWLENTISAISLAPVGALVASRRPENPVGWLMCLLGLAYSIGHSGAQYAIYALSGATNSPPAGEAAAWIASWILPIITGLQVFAFLLFPTGRLPGRGWRWLAWLTVAFVLAGVISSAFSFGANAGLGTIRNPLGIEGVSDVYDIVLSSIPFLFAAAAFSQFVRMRRASGVERQQIKWFAYAVAATIVGITLAYMIPDTTDTPLWFDRVGFVLNVAVTPTIPVAIGIAILRYRLYNIDLIINRTLVYGSLTAMLATLYFWGVAVTQMVFRTMTGGESQLAIVASTLAIAVVFNPLQCRIQETVDRRFYRRKYDARQTLEAFSTRLREETDLDALNTALVGVVGETVQPAHLSLWMRHDAEHHDARAS